MDFYLQFGHGMMAHTEELIERWDGGGAILSPRDLDENQLRRVAEVVRDKGGEPLLDPQCFARDADHEKLISHDYQQAFRANPTGVGTPRVLERLARLASSLGVARHLLPGSFLTTVNDTWFDYHEDVIERAPSCFGEEPLFATIALSAATVRDEEQIEELVERVSEWNVVGFYVLLETPDGAYLVDDPVWLGNALLLLAGLKLIDGRQVILGYSNHQMLVAAAANIDVMASGTWLNVRRFAPDKFYAPDEDAVSRRATWCYCPQALSEYTLPYLDIAFRAGVLPSMRPPRALDCEFADPLFDPRVNPGSVEWKEPSAFRHYLCCLRAQAAAATQHSYDATQEQLGRSLDSADRLLARLRREGVNGKDRDFNGLADVSRSALAQLNRARGARLRREWA